jgi:hypothetical protein
MSVMKPHAYRVQKDGYLITDNFNSNSISIQTNAIDVMQLWKAA